MNALTQAMILLALAVPLAVALQRDAERAERRAATRRLMRTSAAAKIARDFEEMSRKIGEMMRPALTEAARGLAELSGKLRPVTAWVLAADVPAWRRPVVRWWRRNGSRWPR